jgi:hypothetical protein
MSNKEKYRLLCKNEKSIPIFSQDTWLDYTCGNDWDVCIITENNKIVASMPYFFKKNLVLNT